MPNNCFALWVVHGKEEIFICHDRVIRNTAKAKEPMRGIFFRQIFTRCVSSDGSWSVATDIGWFIGVSTAVGQLLKLKVEYCLSKRNISCFRTRRPHRLKRFSSLLFLQHEGSTQSSLSNKTLLSNPLIFNECCLFGMTVATLRGWEWDCRVKKWINKIKCTFNRVYEGTEPSGEFFIDNSQSGNLLRTQSNDCEFAYFLTQDWDPLLEMD